MTSDPTESRAKVPLPIMVKLKDIDHLLVRLFLY